MGFSTSDVLSVSSSIPDCNFLSYGYIFNTKTRFACTAISFVPEGTTSVGLEAFTATAFSAGVALNWRAGQEAANLGYRLFREDAGQRVLITPELIAGSALSYPGSPLQAGYTYGWWDPEGTATSKYLLEDIELGGRETLHGPFSAEFGQDSQITPRQRPSGHRKGWSMQSLKAGRHPMPRCTVFDRRQIGEANRQKQWALGPGGGKVVASRMVSAHGTNWCRRSGDPRFQVSSLQLFVNGRAGDSERRWRWFIDAADSIEFTGPAREPVGGNPTTGSLEASGTERIVTWPLSEGEGDHDDI
jgi:hypothetical protein